MPDLIRQIKETMVKKGISGETIAQFDFSGKKENQSMTIIKLVNQMDKLLSKEQCLSIMEEQGCCTTGKPAKAHNDFGRKYAGKTIGEKISLFDKMETGHKPLCKLNGNGTVSAFWGNENGNNKCVCGFIKKLTEPVPVSKTFCGCCGGHVRKNLQRSLGVKLHLTKIVSSAVNSKGKKRCEFLFKVEG